MTAEPDRRSLLDELIARVRDALGPEHPTVREIEADMDNLKEVDDHAVHDRQ